MIALPGCLTASYSTAETKLETKIDMIYYLAVLRLACRSIAELCRSAPLQICREGKAKVMEGMGKMMENFIKLTRSGVISCNFAACDS